MDLNQTNKAISHRLAWGFVSGVAGTFPGPASGINYNVLVDQGINFHGLPGEFTAIQPRRLFPTDTIIESPAPIGHPVFIVLKGEDVTFHLFPEGEVYGTEDC